MERNVSEELRLEEVSRRFGDVVALDSTSLRVPAGELMALLGPSGCGKTTTLRIIAGLEAPDTGRVLLGDRDLSELPPNRRGLGMVFQDYSLFPHMTVEENVGFGLRMAGVARAEISRRIRAILDLVRLTGLDDRYPNQLSGGQQQRVALARSLVTNPSVLLLDEPLGALDKNLRESMQFELRRIQRRLGITTVMVTHDQEEALTLSDRVAVMHRGRVLQVGSPREVYDFPNSRFVSEFLGTANLFEGRLVERRDDHYATILVANGAEDGIPIRFVRRDDLPREGAATIAVRPEKMTIAPEPASDQNSARAEIVGHVFRGTYHTYELRVLGCAGPVFVYDQARSRVGERVFEPGEKVFIHWTPEDSIVFEEGGA